VRARGVFGVVVGRREMQILGHEEASKKICVGRVQGAVQTKKHCS
tara:strand:+ start:183 stop:317 length:135 start_codon:yes stop_codon:yes gene_type:complete